MKAESVLTFLIDLVLALEVLVLLGVQLVAVYALIRMFLL